jgi:hypothetical protein
MTTRSTQGWETGYDAVTWQNMPNGRFYYLYVDGDYRAPAAAFQALGARGRIATIAVNSGTVANEYDYENGNENDPVAWCRMMRRLYGYKGVVYCAESSVAGILAKFDMAGVAYPYFRIADWTRVPPAEVTVYGAGTVAVQDADTGGYDVNLIAPDYPAIGPLLGPPAPPVTPPAPPAREDDMKNHVSILRVTNHEEVYAHNWVTGKTWHIVDITSLEAYIAAGVEQLTIDEAELANYPIG